MIRGVHTMFYSSEPEALRAFLRDKLGFPYTDVGDGWLIFDLPEADMGCHPAEKAGGEGAPSGTHHISFYCDDINETVAQLQGRGVEFTGHVEDHGYGLVTHFKVPGGFAVQLYQPRYVKNVVTSGKQAKAKVANTARRRPAKRRSRSARAKVAPKKRG
jgi:catechol 2,3-dioxygenase-like lactoylglutathione lyase family enzyme